MTEAKVKPIFLLGDSQLLFWKDKKGMFLDRVFQLVVEGEEDKKVKAAYIGASNGDDPLFYEIFLSAMGQIGVGECRHILAKAKEKDVEFLKEADIVLLSGGETETGLKVIKENGWDEILVERYHKGAVLMGISAGAVQLGLKGWRQNEKGEYFLLDTLKIVPYIIDVHDEEGEWNRLDQAVKETGKYTKGFGIPIGGGAVFHEDWSIEAIRYSLAEFSFLDEGMKNSLILPPVDENKKESKSALKGK